MWPARRPISVCAWLILWLASASAYASSSLSFEGSGYWIDLEVGADREASIASVRFHAPDDRIGVILPRAEWHVETFDSGQRVLELQHTAGRSGVAPFRLSVRQENATLTIRDRTIVAPFDWEQ